MFNKYHLTSQPRPDVPFRRGLFKYIVLQYLQDKPSHGYELIQALASRFHGLYVPSPGTVYPRLGILEKQGYVTHQDQEGRKVYSITDEGRQFLADNLELEKEINDRLSNWENPDNIEDIKKTVRALARLSETLTWEIRKMDNTKLREVQEVLQTACDSIESILQDQQ